MNYLGRSNEISRVLIRETLRSESGKGDGTRGSEAGRRRCALKMEDGVMSQGKQEALRN